MSYALPDGGEINETKQLWIIPSERMLKNRREHIVPPSNQAIQVINKIKEIGGIKIPEAHHLFDIIGGGIERGEKMHIAL